MIQLNDFRRQSEDTRQAALEAVTAVSESGWYILVREVVHFERALAGRWGGDFAAGVASGLDALEVSLRILGCRPLRAAAEAEEPR